MLSEEEKYIKAIEWLENASYNCGNISKIGVGLVPMIKSQIDNAIKYLRNEDIDEEIMFGGK